MTQFVYLHVHSFLLLRILDKIGNLNRRNAGEVKMKNKKMNYSVHDIGMKQIVM